MSLNTKDAGQLIRYGSMFGKHGDVAPCMAAAQMHAVAKDDEKASVRSEFEEGVRNNVPHMAAYDDRMWQFDDWCRYFAENS